MVILLSALAVVVAAILLIAWVVVQGGFVLIYAAMGFAVLSIVLLWAARWIGSSPDPELSEGPAPLPELEADAETEAEADDRAEDVGSAAPARERPAATAARPRREADDDLPLFPIAEYDTLWVSQIVPLVGELDHDELAVVEARERGGRHRAAVLDAIAEARAGQAGSAEHAVPAARVPRSTSDAEPPPADEAWAPVEVATGDGDGDGDRGAEPVPSGTASADDGWLVDDREPFDWTGAQGRSGDEPDAVAEAAPAPAPEVEVEVPVDAGATPEPEPEPEVEAGPAGAAAVEPEPDVEAGPAGGAAVEPEPDVEAGLAGGAAVEPEPEVEVDPVAAAEEPEVPAAPEVSEVGAAGDPPAGPAASDDGDEGWDGIEPDAWDWSAIRGADVRRDRAGPSSLVRDEVEGEHEEEDEDEPEVDVREPHPDDAVFAASTAAADPVPQPEGAPTVRTFLGHRRSPVTVRRD